MRTTKLDAVAAADINGGLSASDVPVKSVEIGDIKVAFGSTQVSSFSKLRSAVPQLTEVPDSALSLLEPYLFASTNRYATFSVVS